MTAPVLQVRGLRKAYGAVVVADGLDLDVPAGQALGVIGPNGAGKTTLLGLVGGDVRPDAGQVLLDGEDVTALPAARRARLGIGRTYQVPRPFAGLTTFENALVSAQHGAGLSGGRSHDAAAEALRTSGLLDRANVLAGDLGLLARKRLELARALATRPKLLLLDEIAGGLTEGEVDELVETVRALVDAGTTVVWIEHVVRALQGTVERLVCLHGGTWLADGTCEQVLADGAVREVYLGSPALQAGLPQLVGTCRPARAHRRWSRACGRREPPIRVGTRRGVSRSTAGAATWSSSSRGPSMPPPAAASATRRERAVVTRPSGRARPFLQVSGALGELVCLSTAEVRAGGGGAVSALLEVDALNAHHGHLHALRDVSLSLPAGSTLAVVGANGAGKSTLLRTVAGLGAASSGRVLLDGADLHGVPAHRRVRAGIALVPEGRRLFASLTVQENLQVGGQSRRPGPWSLERVFELFPLLRERAGQRASTLSGGQQQAVAIGRALMANPRLLLLDEVSLGLAPVVVGQLYAALPGITGSGTTVLVVEQDLGQVLRVADTVTCLLEGRVVLSGSAGQLSREQIADAYFGHRTAAAHP